MASLIKNIALGASSLLLATSIAATSASAMNNARVSGAKIPGVTNLLSPYAQAIAFAGNGILREAKGVVSMSHPITGVYCFQLAGNVIKNFTEPVVSIEWANSLGVALFAQYNKANTDCVAPNAHTVSVRTYKGDVGGIGSALQVPVLDDRVDFIILVP
jgi:hypothetical protein